jgi:hypothetical protein
MDLTCCTVFDIGIQNIHLNEGRSADALLNVHISHCELQSDQVQAQTLSLLLCLMSGIVV